MAGTYNNPYTNPWGGVGYPYSANTFTPNPPQYDLPQLNMTQQNNISVVFIHGGDEAADKYLMAPNQTLLLIDNESGMVYIKETNGSGMTIINRKFKEEKQVPVQQLQADFITRDEFEKRIAELNNAKLSE